MSLRCPTEEQEQRRLALYLDRLGLLWCHVPNGGNRNKITGGKLKAQGTKRGVPDVLIFESPPKHPNALGVAVELKRQKGGKLSNEQRTWLLRLSERGFVTYVAHGFEDARDFLAGLGWGLNAALLLGNPPAEANPRGIGKATPGEGLKPAGANVASLTGKNKKTKAAQGEAGTTQREGLGD